MSQSQDPRVRASIERILVVAEQEFGASGYDAMSIDRIAASSGVAKTTIYRHFRSKEDLLRGLVRRVVGRLSAELGTLDPEQPIAEVLVALALRLNKIYSHPDHIRMERALIGVAERFPDITGSAWNESESAMRALSMYLSQLIRKGVLRPVDPDSVARLFWRMVVEAHRFLLYGRGADNKAELIGQIESQVDIFLHGVKR